MSRFGSWSRLRKAALVFGTTFGVCFAAFYAYVITREQPKCEQPCNEFEEPYDLEKRPGLDSVIIPKCSPIRLSLELAEPRARTGTWYTLWYRVGLTYFGCGSLSNSISDLRAPLRAPTVALKFRIWDPDGNIVPPGGEAPFKGVEPYAFDSPIDAETEEYVRDLQPGETVYSNSSIYRPRLIPLEGHGDEPSLEEEFPGERFRKLRAKLQALEDERFRKGLEILQPLRKPIPGYRVLDTYAFDKPGKYRIQAVFDDRTFIDPPGPWHFELPSGINLIADHILRIHGRAPNFEDYRAKYVRVRAESEILEFEVLP